MALEIDVLQENEPATPIEAPRSLVPAAFYRDDDPPEPPEDDPHWREFPLFESIRGSRLLVVAIVLGVCFATFAHIAVLLFI